MSSFTVFFFVIPYLVSPYFSSAARRPSDGSESDRVVLLEFKNQISNDPDGVFSSWNGTVDFCRWPGVTCDRHLPRVTRLQLPSLGIGGSLSPYVGNLSFLRVLDIQNNSFTGEIPQEIGRLRRLMILGLTNNSFLGRIPENISGCGNLRGIGLSNNMLIGELPQGLAALSKLRKLLIYNNNLTGNLPDFFVNFSSLEVIDGAYNGFTGALSDSLGKMRSLRYLLLSVNLFSGPIPTSIFNITSLEEIELSNNQLGGMLPSDLGVTLPNLVNFDVGINYLTGQIPPSITNASKLVLFAIGGNNFSGLVPDLRNLNELRWLSLSLNNLGRGVAGDLRFVESLNSTGLLLLEFDTNNFGGPLPRSIGNLSSQLNFLSVMLNQLTGTIPSSIGNLGNLEALYISGNQFTGSLPDEIGNLHKLKEFIALNNEFSGMIPSSFGNLTKLTILGLLGNNLRGGIPTSLGNCQNLIGMDLSRNSLSGSIPPQVLSISSLSVFLDLSENELSGTLPDEIGNLNNLARLYLHKNRLSGQVPHALGRCISLEELYLGNNLFEGNVTLFLSPLKALQYVDLSHNDFSGEIPRFLEDFQLIYLNLSFNHFEGEVPNRGVFFNATGLSVIGNGNICGGIAAINLPSCPTTKRKNRRKISTKVILMTVCGISVLFIMLLLATYIGRRRNRIRNVKPHFELVPLAPFPQISYEDILGATEGLNQNNLIGAGSFGCVYKGILENREKKEVAVKVLDLQNRAASKSFMAECEALRNIRHRNLVKIVTTCSTIDFRGNDFKALVYEYMENGSLEGWLHPEAVREGARAYGRLSLTNRLSIAIDVARALEYLHRECETPIIHCDLKPSNVLLDADLTAHVSDFGIARILSDVEALLQSSSVGVKGTIGYSPPEYGMGNDVSREGDVYSYGILLLEMMTGKRPTNYIFQDTWSIRSYCEAALPERAADIADPDMFSNELGAGHNRRDESRMRECLVKALEIGIGCCREMPGERMDIREVATKLQSVKALAR